MASPSLSSGATRAVRTPRAIPRSLRSGKFGLRLLRGHERGSFDDRLSARPARRVAIERDLSLDAAHGGNRAEMRRQRRKSSPSMRRTTDIIGLAQASPRSQRWHRVQTEDRFGSWRSSARFRSSRPAVPALRRVPVLAHPLSAPVWAETLSLAELLAFAFGFFATFFFVVAIIILTRG